MKDSGESLLTVFDHEVLMYQIERKECTTYVSCFHTGTLKDKGSYHCFTSGETEAPDRLNNLLKIVQ